MGTKHTPGPWKAGKPLQATGAIPIRFGTMAADNLAWICAEDTCIDRATAKANAALIAAAPELLAACKAVVDECDAVFVSDDEMSAVWQAIEKQCRAAIARAEWQNGGKALDPERVSAALAQQNVTPPIGQRGYTLP